MKERKSFKNRIKNVYEMLSRNELRILPGSLAYSFFFAIVPLVSLIFFVTTTFNLPNDIVHDFIVKTFPSGVAELIQPVFNTTMSLSTLIPIIMGIFVSMNGCGSLIIASNTVYGFENASIFKRYIKSLILVILLMVLFIFILIVPLFGRTIINLIASVSDVIANNRKYVDILYFLLQVPISLLIIWFVVKLVYLIAPDGKIPSKCVNKGSRFTTILWLIATIIFSYYINNIARYDVLYGNLANMVILLFWFYIMAYIFVIGLCLNKKVSDINIERTNSVKLEEIRNKIKENK